MSHDSRHFYPMEDAAAALYQPEINTDGLEAIMQRKCKSDGAALLVDLDQWDLTHEDVKQLELHQRFWVNKDRKPRPSSQAGNAIDLIANIPGAAIAKKLFGGKIFIFEEYMLMLRIINAKLQGGRRGVVITGTPGIGKTTFLLYLLILSLSVQQPIAFYSKPNIYLHLPSGVWKVTDFGPIKRSIFSQLICLVDMDWSGESPDDLSLENYNFIVAATSPKDERYKKWKKQSGLDRVVMNPPEIKEILPLFQDKGKQKMVQKLAARSVGPIIRQLLELSRRANYEDALEAMDKDFEDAARKLTYDNMLELTSPGSDVPAFTHAISITKRRGLYQDGHDAYKLLNWKDNEDYSIRSARAYRFVLQKWGKLSIQQRRALYNEFSSSSQLAAGKGWAFEALVHADVMSHEELPLVPMKMEFLQQGMHLSKQEGVPKWSISIGQRYLEKYSPSNSAAVTISEDAYYVPEYSNNATFDAFLHAGLHTYVFQMTTSTFHTIKNKGLTDCHKRAEAKNGSKKIRYVFAIPEGQTFSGTYPQRYNDVEFYTWGVVVSEYFRKMFLENDGGDDSGDIESDKEDVEMVVA